MNNTYNSKTMHKNTKQCTKIINAVHDTILTENILETHFHTTKEGGRISNCFRLACATGCRYYLTLHGTSPRGWDYHTDSTLTEESSCSATIFRHARSLRQNSRQHYGRRMPLHAFPSLRLYWPYFPDTAAFRS